MGEYAFGACGHKKRDTTNSWCLGVCVVREVLFLFEALAVFKLGLNDEENVVVLVFAHILLLCLLDDEIDNFVEVNLNKAIAVRFSVDLRYYRYQYFE